MDYDLLEEQSGNTSAALGISGSFYFTDAFTSGRMTITRLDLNAQIVSGTFFFDVIDSNGNLREIRDGRFDMRFTQ